MNLSTRIRITIILLTLSSLFFKTNAQELVVKTNMPYWLTATPNIGVEYAFTKKMSFELTGGINPFKFGDDARIKHWVVWPELRYWTYEALNGHFIGIHGFAAKFDVGGWDLGISKLKPMKDKSYQGSIYGAGISYGYLWILNNYWSLELTAGVGIARFDYDTFTLSSKEYKIGVGKKNYIGPTKGAFSLVYTIK